MRFSPDGKLMALAGTVKTELPKGGPALTGVQVWDVSNPNVPTPRHIMEKADTPISTVAFSPDGTLLAAAGSGRTVTVWNLRTRKEVHTLLGHGQGIVGLAFGPGGDLLASASLDRTLKWWDLQQPRGDEMASPSPPRTVSAAYVRDDRTLYTSTFGLIDTQGVQTWEVASRQATGSVFADPTQLFSLAVSPNRSLLALGGQAHAKGATNSVILLDPALPTLRTELGTHPAGVATIDFSPDGRWLATLDYQKNLKLWDIEAKKEITPANLGPVDAAAFQAGSQTLVTARDNVLTFRRLPGLAPERELTLDGAGPWRFALSPDGRWLALAGREPLVRLLALPGGGPHKDVTGFLQLPGSMTFSPDSRTLAVVSGSEVILIDPVTGHVRGSLDAPADTLSCLAFSHDGRKLAGGGSQLHLWAGVRDAAVTAPPQTLPRREPPRPEPPPVCAAADRPQRRPDAQPVPRLAPGQRGRRGRRHGHTPPREGPRSGGPAGGQLPHVRGR